VDEFVVYYNNGILIDCAGEQFRLAVHLLLMKGCKGILKKDQVTNTVRELMVIQPHAGSILGDVFAAIDEYTSSRQNLRDKFINITRGVEGFLGTALLEKLNLDNLSEVGLVPNKKLFTTRFIRTKTKL
jgi:hypothetical protein